MRTTSQNDQGSAPDRCQRRHVASPRCGSARCSPCHLPGRRSCLPGLPDACAAGRVERGPEERRPSVLDRRRHCRSTTLSSDMSAAVTLTRLRRDRCQVEPLTAQPFDRLAECRSLAIMRHDLSIVAAVRCLTPRSSRRHRSTATRSKSRRRSTGSHHTRSGSRSEVPAHGQGYLGLRRRRDDHLSRLIVDQPVVCTELEVDRHGRTIGVCHAGDADLGAAMVASGFAWAYTQYSEDYLPEQRAAEAGGVGIWQHPTQAPWGFRADRWAGLRMRLPTDAQSRATS